MESFLFVSPIVEFEESEIKGATVNATVLELEKVSKNGRLYRIEEAKSIIKSLIGIPVYHGTDWAGRHDNPIARGDSSKAKPIGFIEKAWQLANKIKASIKITSQGIIESLKQGAKYLFSVGGHALSETIKKVKGKIVHILKGAKVNHLQMVPQGTPVGFPNAKMEEIVEINETVMFCKNGICKWCPEDFEETIEEIEISGGSYICGIEVDE